ncbi:MAG: hypothetical protein ACOYM9_25115 [Bradymonadia bacterium]|jgi:hypothetical protein
MAGERKENSVLFSLKELKDFTSDDPAEPAARPASASKAAPTPTPRRPSALDDMGSLLADIRSTVNEDVEAEARRLEEEKKRQREEEDRKIKETSALQKADIEARIAAEQARRRAAEDERAERLRRQDIEERRARGEIIEEPAPPAAIEVVQAPSLAALSAASVPQSALAPQPPQGRGTGFYLTVVGLPVMCITAIAIALILNTKEQQVVVNMPAPQAPETISVVATMPPLPELKAVGGPPTEPPSLASAPKPKPKRPAGEGKGPPKPPAPKTAGIKIDINAD